ncbi:hypothetical protein Hanom_Chr03g00200071 [Helianthus anomalus]
MATSCCEYACGKFPNNLELMMGLFSCYVRGYSFVKQQQVDDIPIYFTFIIIFSKMYKVVDVNFFFFC